jgi:hypothetical protein
MENFNIKKIINQVNHDWFQAKLNSFKREGLYHNKDNVIYPAEHELDYDDLQKPAKHAPEEIPLERYCWNAKYNGSDAYTCFIHMGNQNPFPMDAQAIVDQIIHLIEAGTHKFTDLQVIKQVIDDVLLEVEIELGILKQGSKDSEYLHILNTVERGIRHEVWKEYQHIARQLEIINKKRMDKQLTLSMCERIAEITLPKGRLIRSISGEQVSLGEALLYAINPHRIPTRNLRVYCDGWNKQDVYFLLYKVRQSLSTGLNFQLIQDRNSLRLKNADRFYRDAYAKFSSGVANTYQTRPLSQKIIASLNTILN